MKIPAAPAAERPSWMLLLAAPSDEVDEAAEPLAVEEPVHSELVIDRGESVVNCNLPVEEAVPEAEEPEPEEPELEEPEAEEPVAVAEAELEAAVLLPEPAVA